eukprot:1334857-Karenia_brevis.AAC.1
MRSAARSTQLGDLPVDISHFEEIPPQIQTGCAAMCSLLFNMIVISAVLRCYKHLDVPITHRGLKSKNEHEHDDANDDDVTHRRDRQSDREGISLLYYLEPEQNKPVPFC